MLHTSWIFCHLFYLFNAQYCSSSLYCLWHWLCMWTYSVSVYSMQCGYTSLLVSTSGYRCYGKMVRCVINWLNVLLESIMWFVSCTCVLGHEQILIFHIQTFFNFQFQMFKCVLMPTQWVFNSVINLCGDNFMVKTSNRYLPLLTYSNKGTFCIKFAHNQAYCKYN